MSALSTVDGIKSSLSKLLPLDDELNVDQCQDMFQQLEDCEITLDILTKTLIGTVVSKFKGHEEVGPIAKALLKKWKKAAKGEASSQKIIKKLAPRPHAERRDSTASANSATLADAKDEWAELQPHRCSSVEKLHSFLLGSKKSLVKQGINASAVDHLAVESATNVEAAIQKSFSKDKQGYLGKARSLCFNIKKNVALAGQVLLGQIPADELVAMTSDQLASDERRKEMEERTKNVMDKNLLDWDQANESKINEMCGIRGDLLRASLFTCGRCKSIKTTSTQKQTRSADEPMTVFVLCLNCGKRWKC
jgi:transcription elongation factor S-II